MSEKSEHIGGGLSVGGNASVGGGLNVQGSARIGHNLTIDGWLDAKNIKGSMKGVFTDIASLRSTYPDGTLADGTWAIVGNTLPGELWTVIGGKWVDSGTTTGEVTIDMQSYEEKAAQLSSAVNSLQAAVDEVNVTNKTQDDRLSKVEQGVQDTQDLQSHVNDLSGQVRQMLEGNEDDTIESFNEVIRFLSGQKDSETLSSLLNALDSRISKEEVDSQEGYRFMGLASENTEPGEMVQRACYLATESGIYEGFLDGNGAALVLFPGQCALLYNDGPDSDGRQTYWKKDIVALDESVVQIVRESLMGGSDGFLPTLDANGTISAEYLPAIPPEVVMVGCKKEAGAEVPSTSVYARYYDVDAKKLYARSEAGEWVEEATRDGVIYVNTEENVPYRWSGTDMVPIAAKDIPASIFNATVEVPLSNGGYYTLCDPNNPTLSAIHVAWNAKKAVGGLIIAFALSADIWKTYQYVGKSVTETNWLNPDNWKDFGSMAQGSEAMIDIDTLVPLMTGYYTLDTALSALKTYQSNTGVSYQKRGLVISYASAANSVETKQYQGDSALTDDFWIPELWQDFGGGGSDVETSDEPSEGGKDAWSTGGAWKSVPSTLGVDTETEGVIKLWMKNAGGEQVGDEVQFGVGTGSGGGTGTIVQLAYEESPLYVKAGGSVVIKASVRSVTTQGTTESVNTIEKLELIDRDTNQTLETLNVNKNSSATLETYDYNIDVTAYFTTAGQRRFRIVATDDGGHTGSKNVNVTAVDVTIQSVQTLNYTVNTALSAGGVSKTLPMYRYPNNASDKGIKTTTEIYLNGSWQTLGTATVMDTYSHSVAIDPADCLGVRLTHGSYPLRIHGEDVGSGVRGNYLYTSVMVVDDGNTAPIISTRWYSDDEDASKKLFESLTVDYAVYDPRSNDPTAEVYEDGVLMARRVAYRSQTYTYTRKITDVAYDGTKTIHVSVKSGSSTSQTTAVTVSGTLLDISEVDTQRQFSLDFSGRSNNESDHTISDNGVRLDVEGVNWSTNGFVLDNFGTSAKDGSMALRIAENAKGTLHYKPFADNDIETNGMALQFTLMKKNIATDSARLLKCISSSGFGLYMDGGNIVFTFDGGKTVARTITAALDDGEKTTVAIVIEPTSVAPYAGIGVAKMYFDGEEIGACYYDSNSIVAHASEVTFDGADGDLYLYNIKAWKTYFGFEQEFNNYLLTMTDTDAMVEEYEFNHVMESQTAENTTKNRPQSTALYDLGIPYFVLCKNADTADNDAKDNYPEYLETLDGDKKTKRMLDVYAYFPERPWQDFKAIGVSTTNQGTTSSKRPIKNIKMKFKGSTITLLHTEADFTGADLDKFKECEKNAAKQRVQITDDSLPTNIVTVKVDYSESGGANNGASTNLFNDLQRGLGDHYITPAQKAYNGTTGYIINTSIRSIPCAFFRTDRYSPDATSPSYGYFHAKGNWNEDKGDAKVFGFEGVKGYNADCLNYGDFIELVAAKGQSLSDYASTVDKSSWVSVNGDGEENVYVLSEFCGPGHKVYRYKDGSWTETTGNMTYTGGKWVVTGDVVNPVENYEMLKYDALDWFMGVDSVDDMLVPDTDGLPIWLQYFESRYPDDDNLNALYEAGKKVPYQLYRWLRFCQDCNYTLESGNITIGGEIVAGTKENRLKKWQQELHTVANVYSVLCYHVFTDYIAAVDQRSKNMMVGFYLDEDGVVRMYLNHLYDGDTILGSDNDCGLTVPALVDPNDDDAGVYQGHGSVLFTQIANMGNEGFWLDDAGGNTITTRQVAQAMRNYTSAEGLRPFSYDGIVKYWVTDRLQKWPKVVSSFDGERKYIEHSKATANYFYALHGLSIKRLKDFVKTRYLYRDGFYQTGDLFSSMVSMRCTGTDVTVKITAAKEGYFGIGVDRANTATDSCYLKAGESYTLKSGMTNEGSGTMLYIFGADKLSKLDISDATPSPASWDISALTLVKELIIGGEDYTPTNNTQGYLTTLSLGSLPFLEKLDIRNTAITTVDAKYCPRLKAVLADGSQLTRVDLAEQGALETLSLPGTYTDLSLKYLPSLEDEGLRFANAGSVETLVVEGCSKIDGWSLLMKLATAPGSKLQYVRVSGIRASGDGAELTTLKGLGLEGVDATGTSGGEAQLLGTYQLTKYTDDATLQGWRQSLGTLNIIQQLYSDYVEDDMAENGDSANVSNLDNQTGYQFEKKYEPSGHIVKIRQKSVPVKGKYDPKTGAMTLTKLSEIDYHKYADGTDFDYTDKLKERYDVFMYIPHYWYKGINDFNHQQKHTLLSSNPECPSPTWTRKNEQKLSDILVAESKGVSVEGLSAGDTFKIDENLQTAGACSVYRVDVEGMKLVRHPTVNSGSNGSVFVDGNDKVVSTHTLSIAGSMQSPLDFDAAEGDYEYYAVPAGAKWLYFTCAKNLDDSVMVRAVDSSDIEALEDWVEHKSTLIGVYGGSINPDTGEEGIIRSISGQKTLVGKGTSQTYAGWNYDSAGNPTDMPTDALNYTLQDMLNLCVLRGKGYHAVDYEQGKAIAILSRCWSGNRNDQGVYGYGSGTQYDTGQRDTMGKTDTVYGTDTGIPNKIWGIEGFVGSNWEVMDNVGVNIKDFASWKANRRGNGNTEDPTDGQWHIADARTREERVVPCVKTTGYNIARVRHGRYCDTIASSTSDDNSKFSTFYAASYVYNQNGRGLCVGRAGYNARAVGGLVFASANYASSYSWGDYGVRLAFDGELANESDIDSDIEAT